MASADEIIADALELDEKERARVAHELLRSLDHGEDEEAVDAWTDELRRRLQEVKDGTVELDDWDDVRGRLAARRANR
jgi:putative addiction module component (TIGR02574 family)